MAKPPEPCPKCREVRRLTRHHVLPVRWYGRRGNNWIFRLCRDCHNNLEKTIPFQKLPDEMYPKLLLNFLAEVEP